jgi:hypothetical protein
MIDCTQFTNLESAIAFLWLLDTDDPRERIALRRHALILAEGPAQDARHTDPAFGPPLPYTASQFEPLANLSPTGRAAIQRAREDPDSDMMDLIEPDEPTNESIDSFFAPKAETPPPT